ncbi:MAG: hypothetical protein IJ587_09790 [Synergistaceae bacterium]|nr:hypothetical protein [Synergistaceae bacterium]
MSNHENKLNPLVNQDKNIEAKQDAISQTIGQDISIAEELIQDIISINTSYVYNIVLDLNKISSVVFNPEKNLTLYRGHFQRIAMERKGSKKEINALVSINFDSKTMREKGLSIHGNEKLTPFDKIVLDAVNTLYFEGHNEYITTAMVFHVMAGDKNKFMSKEYSEKINNSLIKLLFTHITIDASEEAQMYPKLKDFKYHSTILPGDMVQAKLNGTEVACIHIYRTPPLFLYASHKNQISKIDIALIQKPFAGGKESQESMALLYYLLRRIIAVKSLSNAIKYETLYHELGKDNATRKVKFLIRESAKKILDAWKGSIFGDIKFIGYSEKNLGKTPYEVILDYKYQK